jgi:hypothetical protein
VIDLVQHHILPAAYSLLPAKMNTPEAGALLLAIGLQETGFRARVQVTEGPRLRQWWVGGPARSLWQFEAGGSCTDLLTRASTRRPLQAALKALAYDPELVDPAYLHGLVAHNDVLAAVCARLLLWADSRPLPLEADGPEAGWQCYYRNWKPGKPHRNKWDSCWAEAWRRVAC